MEGFLDFCCLRSKRRSSSWAHLVPHVHIQQLWSGLEVNDGSRLGPCEGTSRGGRAICDLSSGACTVS